MEAAQRRTWCDAAFPVTCLFNDGLLDEVASRRTKGSHAVAVCDGYASRLSRVEAKDRGGRVHKIDLKFSLTLRMDGYPT